MSNIQNGIIIIKRSVNEKSVSLDFIGSVWYLEVKAAFKKNEKRILSEQVLKDKVKGAWAGQTLGCSYGGPTEFKFLGTIIQDYIPIPWNEHMVKNGTIAFRDFMMMSM